MTNHVKLVLALLAILSTSPSGQNPLDPIAARNALVYIGTYTGPATKGIYVSTMNLRSGELSAPQLAAETPNPSYLTLHPAGTFLYAVNEIADYGGKRDGSVSAFAIDAKSGLLRFLNRHSSGGADPAHIIADRAGRHVLVANYTGGSLAVLPTGSDGTLAAPSSVRQHSGKPADPVRQTGPHAHAIQLDSANRFAYAADLGLDRIFIYRFDSKNGSLTPNEPPSARVKPRAGPRHFAIHPQGRFAYVINEIDCTITAFAVDPDSGRLSSIQTVSTLPNGQAVAEGFSTADVQIHPSGRFLFGSNRGHDSIAVFAIDQQSGRLTPVEHEPTEGRTPRAFGIDPGGRWLLAANQRSDSIVVFRIDSDSGRLAPAGHQITVGAPVCIKFLVRE